MRLSRINQFLRDWWNWWDEKSSLGLTRSELLKYALTGLAVFALYFTLNWDWVFGLRQ